MKPSITNFTFILLIVLICTSFASQKVTTTDLVNTKWISPVNDNCYESLCFNSDRTVVYYRCEFNTYLEVSYTINGTNIEVNAFGDGSMGLSSKMVLYEDSGILRQHEDNLNSFPRNFIKVPDGHCN